MTVISIFTNYFLMSLYLPLWTFLLHRLLLLLSLFTLTLTVVDYDYKQPNDEEFILCWTMTGCSQ